MALSRVHQSHGHALLIFLFVSCTGIVYFILNGEFPLGGKKAKSNDISFLHNNEDQEARQFLVNKNDVSSQASRDTTFLRSSKALYTKAALFKKKNSSEEELQFTASRKLGSLSSDIVQALPNATEVMTELTMSGFGRNVTVLIELAPPDELVVLARRNSATEYIPVSRSYDNNDWEASPGLHQRLPITCGLVLNIRKCQLHLTIESDDVYFLTKYTRSVSDRVKVARFLEMTTFGTTLSELDNFDYSNVDQSMALYIKDQIENKPISSHREFYRKHLNVRAVETYKHGVTGPKACEANSRWRSFAFTTKDKKMSDNDPSNFAIKVETKTSSSVTAYLISFAGFPRTVLYQQPQYYDKDRDLTVMGNLVDGEYPICHVEDIEGAKRIDTPYLNPPTFKVVVNGNCHPVVGGNPTVHLDFRFIDSENYHELDLTTSSLIALDSAYSKGSSLLLEADVVSPTCNNIADPQESTHKTYQGDCIATLEGDCDHFLLNSWRNPTKPVFGKVQGDTYVLFDTRLELDENTIENPLADGGGNKVLASAFVAQTSIFDSTPRPAYYCSNAQQTIFNEEHCKLSFDPNVCISSGNGKLDDIVGSSEGTLVCGSEGEVAPDPSEDDYFEIQLSDPDTLDTAVSQTSQRQTIWTHHALFAEDQLRQRMAWALSQIVVLVPSDVTNSGFTEPFLVFYDILVRNALGNYRDILREVSFNVKIGEMLTFKRNRALSFLWHTRKQVQHPDENYARELMQLFTIGLARVNMDGSEVLDELGFPQRTYDSRDIVSFARAWTAFEPQPSRGNVEDIKEMQTTSLLDPMQIKDIRFRDVFPKRGLNNKYIGDRFPLCEDLPERAFLKKGAKYKLLGGNPKPKWQQHWGVNYTDPDTSFFVPDPSSDLFGTLNCKTTDGVCEYSPVITLIRNLQCFGNECNVDTLRQVRIGNVFYEYIRVPCVQMSFYENAKKLSAGRNDDLNMCGNPKLASATEACCGINRDKDKLVFDNPRRADRACEYIGENIKYATNTERCYGLGGYPCDMEGFLHWNQNSNQDCIDDIRHSNKHLWDNIWHWTNAPCRIHVAVQSNGLVALHHDPDKTGHAQPPPTVSLVDVQESMNYFSVVWERNATGDEQFPSVGANGCGNAACQVYDSETCVCETFLSESPVFSSLPTRDEALAELAIGAFPPDMFDPDDYELVESNNGVEAWKKRFHGRQAVPTPSPTSRCDRNLISWNADGETGTTENWYDNRSGGLNIIEVSQPGYNSNFAFRYKSTDTIGNWKRGLYQNLPTECIGPDVGLSISFKVKLLDTTGSSVGCNPHTTSDGNNSCPFVRLQVRNNGADHYFNLGGLTRWKEGEWNQYYSEYIIPSTYDSITLFRPVVVVGGPDSADGRVLLIDDVEVMRDTSVIASEIPSSSPTFSCLYDNLGVNGDAETGLTAPYSGLGGDNATLVVQDESVFAGNYAFKFKAFEFWTGMQKSGIEREFNCISGGTRLQFQFKARLVKDTGNGLVGLACDSTLKEMNVNGQTDASGCPLLRLFVTVDGINYRNQEIWGFHSSWNANGWNTFSGRYTVPGAEGGDVEKFKIQFAPNRYSRWPNDDVFELVDDFEYFVISESESPSNSPTLSTLPSRAPSPSPSKVPSHAPSSVPSQFPTQFPDYNSDTIFKVLDEKEEYIYLKNVNSRVQIGNTGQSEQITYNIRNIPSFYDLSEMAIRDAYYETDAVIDHLLYHENTPPHIAKILIQHFGTSNPSPRYIRSVATAFKTGSYASQGINFGTNKWGDLAATAAAIILDREARVPILDADPLSGSIKEPMNKVIGLMRSMGYTRAHHTKLKYPTLRSGLQQKIGQMPYESQVVFSFFEPGYQPSGSFSHAGLVAPEAQVLDMITILGMSNGLSALIKNGLSSCRNGLGANVKAYSSCDYPSGKLTYEPSTAAANSAEKLIEELSLLLTSGRLGAENRAVIIQQFEDASASSSQEEALQVAQQLIVASPEYQTSNIIRKNGYKRSAVNVPGSAIAPYKAIVNIYLHGGMDSFYMLSPHSSCPLYTEYKNIRGDEATPEVSNLLPLNATSSHDQPCETFSLHRNLAVMKELYDSDMGLFFANTGHLDKPVTKENYRSETKAQLFAHNSMQRESAYVDPFRENVGTGVLGRMLDVLHQKADYTTSSIAIDKHGLILEGSSNFGRPVDVMHNSGVDKFYDDVGSPSSGVTSESMKAAFKELNGNVNSNSGKYAEFWSQAFLEGIDKATSLKAATDNVTLTHDEMFTNSLGKPLKMVSKLIKARSTRGVNRDTFYVKLGGWDHHNDLKGSIEPKYTVVNDALKAFKTEMTTLGLMDQITVIVTSEFARTLSPNSGEGTDHAWGGNYFMMGGEVDGGRILGKYPAGFTKNDPTNDGRGRLIPTTSWDSIWNGVAQWFGITTENDLDYVLPNRGNFGCRLYTDGDLYKNGKHDNVGCGGDTLSFTQHLLLSEARYLSEEEEKGFCEVMKNIAVSVVPGASFHCVILDQKIEAYQDPVCTHRVSLVVELASDKVDVATAVTEAFNSRAAEIHNIFDAESTIQALCGVGNSATPHPSVSTTSPTSDPTLAPASSPTIAPTPAPTATPGPVCSSRASSCNCVVDWRGRRWGSEKQYVKCVRKKLQNTSCDLRDTLAAAGCLPFPNVPTCKKLARKCSCKLKGEKYAKCVKKKIKGKYCNFQAVLKKARARCRG